MCVTRARRNDSISSLHDWSTYGQMTPDVARSVRLLQRHSVRAVVEHAQAVLPATLMAVGTVAPRTVARSAGQFRRQFDDSVDDS